MVLDQALWEQLFAPWPVDVLKNALHFPSTIGEGLPFWIFAGCAQNILTSFLTIRIFWPWVSSSSSLRLSVSEWRRLSRVVLFLGTDTLFCCSTWLQLSCISCLFICYFNSKDFNCTVPCTLAPSSADIIFNFQDLHSMAAARTSGFSISRQGGCSDSPISQLFLFLH